ncbi:DDE domain-containing protein (plasmid) [Azospirillum argentinense]|uniref:DDE domain-containing protein n=1 Tax=Azospirillum argentinense TaxID=2970906 RepID=A0A4D8PS63_9PROT|nr:DDE domain-containing protein [Azospirillum argentinense]
MVYGDAVEHRTSKFKNNHQEQDHRRVKGRTRPMRGFQHPKHRPPLLPGL